MKPKEFQIAEQIAALADSFIIHLKVILAYAPSKAKASDVVDSLLQLGELLEKYLSNRKEYDKTLSLFTSVSQKRVKLCYVNAHSATQWIIKYGWLAICEVNELPCNLWLYLPEHRDKGSKKKLLDDWKQIQLLFDDKCKSFGFAIARYEKHSISNKPIFKTKELPSLSQLEELRSDSKYELELLRSKTEQDTTVGQRPKAITKSKGKGGRPRRSEETISLYQHVLKEYDKDQAYKAILKALEEDRQFREWCVELGMGIDKNLIQAALKYRKDELLRKSP